jgi:hypothetical protein
MDLEMVSYNILAPFHSCKTNSQFSRLTFWDLRLFCIRLSLKVFRFDLAQTVNEIVLLVVKKKYPGSSTIFLNYKIIILNFSNTMMKLLPLDSSYFSLQDTVLRFDCFKSSTS